MTSPGRMYRHILRHDFAAFAHRAFLELNPQPRFEPNWYLEVLAAKLDDVRRGRCRRLIINIPPRHLKSHMASIAFPAWLLGHDPAKQVLAISYGQELSDKLARDCRALMMSAFYKALFETRISADRNAVAEFETTEGGYSPFDIRRRRCDRPRCRPHHCGRSNEGRRRAFGCTSSERECLVR